MAELGQKHDCFKCGTKFYDLRKTPVTCPKCRADQKEAPPLPTSPAMLHAARRAKRDEFADPDLFDRNRDEEEVPGTEPEEAKTVSDEEELPLGENPTLQAPETGEDEY
jgi:uncharacterized protein (TIGR02300 family)